MPADKTIAILDPLSSPAFLAETLRNKGLRTIAAYTVDLSPEVLSTFYKPQLFDIVVNTHGLAEADVVDILTDLNTDYVLYGSEFSVEYTERFASRICPDFANDPATSEYRCNKYMMNRALADSGLANIRQRIVDDDHLDDSTIDSVTAEFGYPVIIKPARAMGTQGFSKCLDAAELRDHFARAVQDRPALSSQSYLIQEFVEGDEYVIDTASVGGTHYVSDVFRNVKQYFGDSNIYLRSEIVSSREGVWSEVTDYVLKVLDIIGLRNGLAHTEVFVTADGPLLLEVNPRIAGASGFLNRISKLVYGWSQPDLLIDVLAGADRTTLDHGGESHGMLVYLNSWEKDHTITELNVAKLATLSSFKDATAVKQPGEIAQPPVTLLDIAAFILLYGEDREAVENDYRTLIQWERAGILI